MIINGYIKDYDLYEKRIKWSRYLIKVETDSSDEFTVKDSFAFAEEIVHQDSKLYMGSLDVDSLFTNIPLEETINICTNLIYDNLDFIEGKFYWR